MLSARCLVLPQGSAKGSCMLCCCCMTSGRQPQGKLGAVNCTGPRRRPAREAGKAHLRCHSQVGEVQSTLRNNSTAQHGTARRCSTGSVSSTRGSSICLSHNVLGRPSHSGLTTRIPIAAAAAAAHEQPLLLLLQQAFQVWVAVGFPPSASALPFP
jgi:hypothetical protein